MGIARYFFRRLFENAILLLFLAAAMFALFRVIPSDPVATIVAPDLSEEAKRQVMEQWGLTDSLFTQFVNYITGILTLDFGTSFAYRRPVLDLLGEKLLNTIVLVVPSVVLATVIGLWIGLRAGLQARSGADRLTLWLPPIVRGIPPFWLGILLLMAFAYGLNLFPIGGMRPLGAPSGTFAERFLTLDFLHHLALPVFCLTITSLPEPILLMRQSVRAVLRDDFVDYLASRGLPQSNLNRHVFWNGSLPVVTWVFHMFGYTLSTTIVVEIVFAWPGLGREMARAVLSYDYPVAQGCFFLIAAIVISLNFVLDLIYPLIDPRITRPGEASQ